MRDDVKNMMGGGFGGGSGRYCVPIGHKDWIVRGCVMNIAVRLSAGWDCDGTGVQEDGERAGGRIRVKRTEQVLRGRERNRGQIRAS